MKNLGAKRIWFPRDAEDSTQLIDRGLTSGATVATVANHQTTCFRQSLQSAIGGEDRWVPRRN